VVQVSQRCRNACQHASISLKPSDDNALRPLGASVRAGYRRLQGRRGDSHAFHVCTHLPAYLRRARAKKGGNPISGK